MRKNNLPVKEDGTPIGKKRRRFTWDDLELTLLSLPTIAWLIAFCYARNYRLDQLAKGKG